MGKRHEVVEFLKEGYSPGKIAELINRNPNTVINYLYWGVGVGLIRRSDIVFIIDRDSRNFIESIISKNNNRHWRHIYEEAEKCGELINKTDLRVYLNLRDALFVWGDMYEFLRDIEIQLHSFIQNVLISEYGEEHWWNKGIPEETKDIVSERGKRPYFVDKNYNYTSFTDLIYILKKQWKIFSSALPKVFSNTKNLMDRLWKLYSIRNVVMHPVNDKKLNDDDFAFVRNFHINELALIKHWKKGENSVDLGSMT